MMAVATAIKLDALILDPKAQPRVQDNVLLIDEYAEAMADGGQFPPITAFGTLERAYVGDGFHRVRAARQAEISELPVDLRPGGLREAILFSCSANGAHGQRPTNADKRRAVETMLTDPEWSQWSDRLIARHCFVTQPMVSAMRKVLVSDNGYQMQPGGEPSASGNAFQMGERLVRRGDQIYTQRTSNIGHGSRPVPKPMPSQPSRRTTSDDSQGVGDEDSGRCRDCGEPFIGRCICMDQPEPEAAPAVTSVGGTPESQAMLSTTPRDILDATPQREASLRAMAAGEEILKEPPEERAYYAISKCRLFLELDPERIAQTCKDPTMDAPEWEQLGAFVTRTAGAVRARSNQPIRIVR